MNTPCPHLTEAWHTLNTPCPSLPKPWRTLKTRCPHLPGPHPVKLSLRLTSSYDFRHFPRRPLPGRRPVSAQGSLALHGRYPCLPRPCPRVHAQHLGPCTRARARARASVQSAKCKVLSASASACARARVRVEMNAREDACLPSFRCSCPSRCSTAGPCPTLPKGCSELE